MDERLKKQIDFVLKIDQEKNVLRQTHLSGHGRRENDAEHSWHMGVMAWLLKEYANEEIDLGRTILMCLIHDIVEIEAGDTYAYDSESIKTQKAREEAAKEKLFSMLPEDQGRELAALWEDFDSWSSPEACFAHTLDNLQPLILNDSNDGGDWTEHGVAAKQVFGRQKKTKVGSEALCRLVTDPLIQKHIRRGNIRDDVRLCVFDLDGTLVATQESIARPVNMTLEHFGLPAQPVEAFNYYAGDGLINTLKRALFDAGDRDAVHLEEGFPLCSRWMAEDPLYHVVPYEGMVETLKELKRRGITLAVLSNKQHPNSVNVVKTIFGEGLFDYVQGQTDEIPMKPDPAGLLNILDYFGIAKDECLYIGDTNTDMLTGQRAAVTTVGVTWGFRKRSELDGCGADIIIDNPAELLQLAGVSKSV